MKHEEDQKKPNIIKRGFLAIGHGIKSVTKRFVESKLIRSIVYFFALVGRLTKKYVIDPVYLALRVAVKYIWLGIKYLFIGIGLILKIVFFPLTLFWRWFSSIPVINRAINSKTMSVIKAICSGIVWGLGQVFNKQYWKALFFFAFFAALIGIELGTSHYFEETNAYDKIPGEDFGDLWIQNSFLADYYYNKIDDGGYQPFEDFLTEIGGPTQLTTDLFIEFLAQDLNDNNPLTYTSLSTGIVNLADEFDASNRIHIIRKQSLYTDGAGTYYLERDIKGDDGSTRKEYVETTILTGVLNENNILYSKDTLTAFVKTGTITDIDGNYYVKASEGTANVYIDIATGVVYPVADFPATTHDVEYLDLIGPVYDITGELFEYFEPNLIYNSVRLQYKSTKLSDTFRQSMVYTFSQAWNQYTNDDYTRFMIRVYYELNPEIRDAFIEDYNNFYYDQAGLFIRGYWSVITLGVAKKVDIKGHMSLYEALIGTRDDDYNLIGVVNVFDSVPIQGHVTLLILIEGLIAIILSLFFLIFGIWSVRDAYKISEQKRRGDKVLKQGEYAKAVYEESFEYIILSPALFVLAFISIMPIAFGFIIAFTSIAGNESQIDTFDWVGFTNFMALFDWTSGLGSSFGAAFWRVLGWTIIWAVFSTFTVFFGGFFQALILNSEKVVFRKFWRTVFILPWAIPALLSQMVFSVIFNEYGFINSMLSSIGVYDILQNMNMLGVNFDSLEGISRLFYLGQDNIQWFSNPKNPTFVRTTLVVVNIWLGFPYFMALMTGVMTAIDRTLYEAADIDGASGFQKITKITMPLVLYSTAPILIMTFSGNFNNFGVIYFITGGGPNSGIVSRGYAGDTDILISWMYQLTVNYKQYNMASVFSVLIFLFVGSLTAWNLSRTRAFTED